jgi:hypothetical protein
VSRGWLEPVVSDLDERIRIEAERAQVVVANTTSRWPWIRPHPLSPPLLSTTSLWLPIIEGFLSLHLPSLSHLALFLSLFLVSLLSFPPFYIHHLDFTIPIPIPS